MRLEYVCVPICPNRREDRTTRFRIYSMSYSNDDRSSSSFYTALSNIATPQRQPITATLVPQPISTVPAEVNYQSAFRQHQHHRHTDVAANNIYTINTTEITLIFFFDNRARTFTPQSLQWIDATGCRGFLLLFPLC